MVLVQAVDHVVILIHEPQHPLEGQAHSGSAVHRLSFELCEGDQLVVRSHHLVMIMQFLPRVGTVVEVPALIEHNDKPHFMTNGDRRIPVLLKIEFQRIYHKTELARSFWIENFEQWVKDGPTFQGVFK